jgi:hypothetical protein
MIRQIALITSKKAIVFDLTLCKNSAQPRSIFAELLATDPFDRKRVR